MPDIFRLKDAPEWFVFVVQGLALIGATALAVGSLFLAILSFGHLCDEFLGTQFPFWQGLAAGVAIGSFATLLALLIATCVAYATKAAK